MDKPRKRKPQRSKKATRVQLRLQLAEKAVLIRAAKLRQTSLNKFILENACQAAQQVLAEQMHFTLPPERWQAFCDALDAPPRQIPALKKLLAEDSIFND